MRLSPRQRRLKADHEALLKLTQESSLFSFTAKSGSPPESYEFIFFGRSVYLTPEGQIAFSSRHLVQVNLGAAYPRMMPELIWKTPIFHPNIAANGFICLGGYGTHWVPSLTLDELCSMLWDMLRYKNFDPHSPYNREAALWAHTQTDHDFPLDRNPLRDRLVKQRSQAQYSNSGSGGYSVAATPDDSWEIEIIEAKVVAPPVIGDRQSARENHCDDVLYIS